MKQRKKKGGFRKPVIIKKQKQLPLQQLSVDPITGKKIPKSFVFSRGKLPAPLKQLQMDLRKLMLPYTALSLRVSRYSLLILLSMCYLYLVPTAANFEENEMLFFVFVLMSSFVYLCSGCCF